jgi:ribosomal protein S27AE
VKAPACRCGAKAFANEAAAQLRFDKIHTKNVPGDKPTGVEQCGYGMWHLHYPAAETGPSPKLRALVEMRDQACARCGVVVARHEDSLHHRLPRGRGGENTAENLVLLCGDGVAGCHGWVEKHRTEAYNLGFLVKTGIDPLNVAVRLTGTVWAYPTPDGRWAFADEDDQPVEDIAYCYRCRAWLPADHDCAQTEQQQEDAA